MKRFIASVISVFVLSLCATYAQSAKVVISKSGEELGTLVSVNGNVVTFEAQDVATANLNEVNIVTYRAADGKGILVRDAIHTGNFNVRKDASTSAPVVGKIMEDKYELPETYPCLGVKNGWYKTRVNGKIGYIRCDLMTWLAIDTF